MSVTMWSVACTARNGMQLKSVPQAGAISELIANVHANVRMKLSKEMPFKSPFSMILLIVSDLYLAGFIGLGLHLRSGSVRCLNTT